jgi:hypothetical protein
MKKLLLLVVIIAGLTIYSCSKNDDKLQTEALQIKASTDMILTAGPCPPGYGVKANYVIDRLNFHKPRTSCNSGFGFCVKGHWEFTCVAGVPIYTPTEITPAGEVKIWLTIVNGKIELHIPTALSQTPEFANIDMTTFEIEDSSISIGKGGSNLGYVKGGVYNVQVVGSDYVVLMNIAN